jgi:hypothetical protein
MPWVRFEPTIPISERAKTVHALDLLVIWCINMLQIREAYESINWKTVHQFHLPKFRTLRKLSRLSDERCAEPWVGTINCELQVKAIIDRLKGSSIREIRNQFSLRDDPPCRSPSHSAWARCVSQGRGRHLTLSCFIANISSQHNSVQGYH